MTDPASRYCSDCAWPYECAAAQNCHRRDLGEVRGESLAPAAARPAPKVVPGRAVLSVRTSNGWETLATEVVRTHRPTIGPVIGPATSRTLTGNLTPEGVEAVRAIIDDLQRNTRGRSRR